ncbi:MAG: response regulator [Bacteroidales bacterium]|nr:response regulator [Bacteroidales bacterium]
MNKIDGKWRDKTIMLVDNDSLAHLLMQEVFAETGINIIESHSGKETVELLADYNNIDLVFMELRLPDISGNQLAPIVRRMHPFIPIIAYTGLTQENSTFNDNWSSRRVLGFNKPGLVNQFTDVVHKPVESSRLKEIVGMYLGG